MLASEAFEGAYVVHPDYTPDIDRLVSGRRPAFLDPPLVGVLQRIHPRNRTGTVYFPGIGLRWLPIAELSNAADWLVDHAMDSFNAQQRANCDDA